MTVLIGVILDANYSLGGDDDSIPEVPGEAGPGGVGCMQEVLNVHLIQQILRSQKEVSHFTEANAHDTPTRRFF